MLAACRERWRKGRAVVARVTICDGWWDNIADSSDEGETRWDNTEDNTVTGGTAEYITAGTGDHDQ